MDQGLLLALITVSLLLLVFFQQFYAGRFRAKLNNLLYREQKSDEFLQKLESFSAKFLIPYNNRLLLKMDAYAMQNKADEINNTFDILEKRRKSFGQKVMIAQRELQFYIETMQLEKAIRSTDRLNEYALMVPQNESIRAMAQQASELMEIYVNKSGNYANKMANYAQHATQRLIKGIYLYRAAKSAYYKKDITKANKYLTEAKHFCKGSVWETHIDDCLENPENLDLK